MVSMWRHNENIRDKNDIRCSHWSVQVQLRVEKKL